MTFKHCGLAYKYRYIDRLPQPQTIHTFQGNLVHNVLETLFRLPKKERTYEHAVEFLNNLWTKLQKEEEFNIIVPEKEHDFFFNNCSTYIDNYFKLEDPTKINAIGIELTVSGNIKGADIYGIIDRVEADENGKIAITDYKTGMSPMERQEKERFIPLQQYAILCEQSYGFVPDYLQLFFLKNGQALKIPYTKQLGRSTNAITGAIWSAIGTASQNDNFKPHVSGLCNWCSFQDICPSWVDKKK